MTTTHERPTTGEVRGDSTTGNVNVDPIAPEQAALPLLAAVIDSPAANVAEVLDTLPPDDVALLDSPTAVVLAAARNLAHRGIDPDAVLLLDALQRAGKISDDHHGRLVANRLEDAVTTYQPAERLRPLAAALAAQLHRVRGVAAGEAIADRYRTGSEDDAFRVLCREGAAVRRAHGVVSELRQVIL